MVFAFVGNNGQSRAMDHGLPDEAVDIASRCKNACAEPVRIFRNYVERLGTYRTGASQYRYFFFWGHVIINVYYNYKVQR